MKPTQKLHDLGQSLWVDNITREMLREGRPQGLHRRPLGHRAHLEPEHLRKGDRRGRRLRRADRRDRRRGRGRGRRRGQRRGERLLRARARRPARRRRPLRRRPQAHRRGRRLRQPRGLAAARRRRQGDDRPGREAPRQGRARQPLHQDPRHPAGLEAIEESIFAGIPINVTLLFDDKQYLAAADAYMKGIERRIEAGLDPVVQSVASIFMSRWDVAVAEEVPAELKNRLGIAIGGRAYHAYRELLDSDRWMRLANHGARAQRLLWASTGTKDPDASDTLYIEAFASPFTVNTMPDKTLEAFADHGEVGDLMDPSGGDAEQVLKAVRRRRDRPRGARPAPPGRGQRELRQVLERTAEDDRRQARGDGRVSGGRRGLAARDARLGAPPVPLRRGPQAPTCATSSPPTRSAASAWSPTAPGSSSTSRRTGSPTRR